MTYLTQEYQAVALELARLPEPSAGSRARSVPDQFTGHLSRTWIVAWILAMGLALTAL